MKTVPLGGKLAAGRLALVDDADYELISQYRWHIFETPRKWRTSGPYARTKPWKTSGFFMHTLITGWQRVDHIDHDGLNNQRSNLRPATTGQNAANGRPRRNPSASPYKGVFRAPRCPRRPWFAYIRADGVSDFLGNFATEEEAARAYDAAALAVWGEYAYLNFPESMPW